MKLVHVNRLSFLRLQAIKYMDMIAHYKDVVGLPIADSSSDSTFFSCGVGSYALSVHRSDQRGFKSLGLEVSRDQSLDDIGNILVHAGIEAHRRSDPFPQISDCLTFEDTDGYQVFLHHGTPSAEIPYSNSGIQPDKLGHVAMFVESATRSKKFYSNVLGFRTSDWVEDYFVFMRCNADHHTMNFQTGARKGMFHFAFELRDFSQIGRSSDILANHGVKLAWGPGRHGPGHNVFTYHRDPDNNIVEFYCDLDRMSDESLGYFDPRPFHQEFPQRPKIWSLKSHPHPSNLWGPAPPAGWRD
jgi:catechol-2,3-dioxygenase